MFILTGVITAEKTKRKYYFITLICAFSSSLYRSKKDTKVLIEDTDDEAFS